MNQPRVSARVRQRSLFEVLEPSLVRWETITEQARREAIRLLAQMLRAPVRGGGDDAVRKEVTDE